MKDFANIKIFNNTEIRGLEVYQVKDHKHAFPEHYHDEQYTLTFVESGGTYSHRHGIVSKEKVALINPGERHSGIPSIKGVSYTGLYVGLELMKSISPYIFESKVNFPEFVCPTAKSSKKIIFLKKWLLKLLALDSDPVEKEVILCEILSELFGKEVKENPDGFEGKDIIRKLKIFLSETDDPRPSLDTMATACQMSKFNFIRIFNKAIGIPPGVYMRQRAILKAKQMIKNGIPLVEVAFRLGFAHQSHFSHDFKKFTSYTSGLFKLYFAGGK